MEWYTYIIVVAVGIVAGIINTLAAGGSLLTLPVLMALGLPPNMANGTNRIAIFLQNVVGVGRFHQEKVMDFPSGFRVGIPAALGAIAGAFIAVNLNDEAMKLAIAAVMWVGQRRETRLRARAEKNVQLAFDAMDQLYTDRSDSHRSQGPAGGRLLYSAGPRGPQHAIPAADCQQRACARSHARRASRLWVNRSAATPSKMAATSRYENA